MNWNDRMWIRYRLIEALLEDGPRSVASLEAKVANARLRKLMHSEAKWLPVVEFERNGETYWRLPSDNVRLFRPRAMMPEYGTAA
jgi:uncharacterized protein YqiB (DUF1249 family)